MEIILLVVALAIGVACASLRLMFDALAEARTLRATAGPATQLQSETPATAAGIAELQAANQRMGELVARMSLEMRRPLGAITGFANLMRNRAEAGVSGHEQMRSLDHILSAADRLIALADEGEEIARTEAGRLSLTLEKLDLTLIVAQCRQALEREAARAGVVLAPPLAMDGFPVLGDPARVREIVATLLGMALKRSGSGAVVSIDIHQADADVLLVVQDSGPLMSAAELERGLTPMVRRDGQWPVAGLAAARRLARAMGGDIEVEPGVAQGLELVLVLPGVGARPVAPIGDAVMHPATVLCIDSDPLNLALMRHLLPSLGPLSVHAAVTGEEGWTLARDIQPDLILLEIELQDVDAFDLMTRLSDDPMTAPIPVVALSGRGGAVDRRRARRAGCASCLARPIQVSVLASALSSALASRPVASPSSSASRFEAAGEFVAPG